MRARKAIALVLGGALGVAAAAFIAAPGAAQLVAPRPAPRATSLPPLPSWRPFIDPVELHQWWFVLLVPMAVLVAMTYKAVRLQTLERYWAHVAIMTAQIIVGMIALGAATYLLVFWFARMVAERAA